MMDDDNNSDSANIPNAGDSPGAGRSFRRERGLSRALSVLRASTKLHQQKRGSSNHMRIMEDEVGLEAEEGSTSIEESSRRRNGSGIGSLPRNLNRQRAQSVVAPVEGQQRRNAPRGDWSPAEEAVLARKHMELGNKWTTISHFLPARSDNDVKNIWHSTLRSKNSERRSFLRTYARAVRDCANDAEARKQAYEMAQRVCGPPQPIEQALAAVQQQYQQQLQMQATQQEDLLGDGDSPEFQPDQDRDVREQEAEPPSCPAGGGTRLAPDCTQLIAAFQPGSQDPLMDPLRSGTCSRTNSAQDSQQLSGVKGAYARGLVCSGAPEITAGRPSTSPLDVLDAAASGSCLPYSAHGQARGSLTLNRGSSHSLGLSSGHVLVGDEPPLHQQKHQQTQLHHQHHQQQQQQLFHTMDLGSRTGAEVVDSSCLARLSALHLADQLLHRQQMRQQQQQQQQQQVNVLPQPTMIALTNSSPVGPLRGSALQHQQQVSWLGQSGFDTLGPAGPVNRSSATGLVQQQQQQQQQQQVSQRGGSQVPEPSSSSAVMGGGTSLGALDLEDMLNLGLDLTAEDLAMLSQGGGQPHRLTNSGAPDLTPALGGISSSHPAEQLRAVQQPNGPPGHLTGSDRQAQRQQQQMQQGQQQYLQQGDAFDSLLAELEQRGRLQVQPQPPLAGMYSLQLPDPHQQQDDVLGLGPLASPYGYPFNRCNPGSLDLQLLGGVPRGGLVAPHNTCVELQSLASCSSTVEMLTSGQQAFVDSSRTPLCHQPSVVARRGSALGMFGNAPGNDSFSNASSGLMSPLVVGSGHTMMNGVHTRHGGCGAQYPLQSPAGINGGGWPPSACAGSTGIPGGPAAGWAPGVLRSSALTSGGAVRTLSSPVAFSGENAAGVIGSGDASAPGLLGSAGTAPQPGGGGGSNGSGPLARGSGLVANMLSLTVPAHVDVVTMGLDSGDLLDVMDCEPEPMPETTSGGGGVVSEEVMEMTLRPSARAALLQRPTPTSTPPPQPTLTPQMAGGRGMLQAGGGSGSSTGGAAGAQPCWSASKVSPTPLSIRSGRLGPLLRL
ncbi:hypothetical protein VaNZ11_009595 [Volvox africanus]|uniref:Uncharacterized protein n=1 Tax=Volvox africanus TaxID=51714 RepID=A0ABQ5S7Q0_9CHLO|nr:hypothetical protein VaNZ11_009595 [Volvox africanus]